MKIIKLTPQTKRNSKPSQLPAFLYKAAPAGSNHPLQFLKNNPNFLTVYPGIIA